MEFNIKNGVTFNDINSYTDLNLILKSKVIGMAEPKSEYISIPGRNGSIDLTNATSELTYYNDRELKFTFVSIDPKDWAEQITDVTRKLHGKRMRIQIDEDTFYYYMGRVTVNSATTEGKALIFEVTCLCEPYKYNIGDGGGNWLWDTFSFETGVIRDYSKIDIDGTEEVIIEVEDMPYVPTIYSDSDNLTVEYDGIIYQLKNGANTFYDMVMTQFSKKLIFRGVGTISIVYKGGVM